MRKTLIRQTAAAVLGISLLLGSLTGCGRNKTGGEKPELLEPITTQTGTVQVEKRELLSAEYLDVTAVPVSTKLYLTISGTIEEINVGVGDLVEKDQVLLVLNQEALEEQIASRQDQYNALSSQYYYSENAASYQVSAARLRQT